MSNLHFFYGTMAASKSTKLITDRYNFEQKGTSVFVIKPKIDRTNEPKIVSRIGLECPANIMEQIRVEYITEQLYDVYMIDEVQFFTENDIDNLVKLADTYKKLVFCFGLLTDVNEELFPASKHLIEVGAKLHNLIASCQNCGCMNLATHHLRYRIQDNSLCLGGDSVVVDDKTQVYYKSVCRQCYNLAKKQATNKRE